MSSAHAPNPDPRTRLGVEDLGERLAPAVYASGGDLWITGSNGNDTVWVGTGYRNDYTVTVNGSTTSIPRSQIWNSRVRFFGNAGNDYFNFSTSNVPLMLEARGGSGNDEIWGGRYNDVISGETGNDSLRSGDGNDSIWGDAGNDLLMGGNGTDQLVGGDGNDSLYGDAGTDYLWGGFGADTFYVWWDADGYYDSGGNNTVYRRGTSIRI